LEGALKTTLNIDDGLLVRAKQAAASERTTLTRLIEEGLNLRLRASRSKRTTAHSRLPIFHGKGGLVAGLDPTSNRSLYDAADEDDGR
jgi:hypothetical protein